jgi:hypothetical protein
VAIILVLLLVGGGAGYALMSKNKKEANNSNKSPATTASTETKLDANSVFDKMLDKLLSTSNVTEHDTLNMNIPGDSIPVSAVADTTIHTDVGNFGKARGDIDLRMQIKSSKASIDSDVEYVADGVNDYVNIHSVRENSAPVAQLNTYYNKWLPVVQNGKAIATSSSNILFSQDDLAFPQVDQNFILVGNFTDTQSKELKDLMTSSKVYTYDASKAQTKTENGHKYLVYDVKLDVNAMVAVYQKALGYYSLTLSQALKNNMTNVTITKDEMWVDTSTNELAKINLTIAGDTPGTETSLYSDYGKTTVAPDPKLDLTATDTSKLYTLLGSLGL